MEAQSVVLGRGDTNNNEGTKYMNITSNYTMLQNICISQCFR
jgi:hypothetical protein